MKFTFFLLIFFSCASVEKENKTIEISTVDLEENEQQKSPFAVDVSIDSKKYGPSSEDESLSIQKKSKIFGFYIGAGIYRSAFSLPIHERLNELKISPQLYSGAGLGLFFASYLAAGKSIDQVEWFLFKLKKKLNQFEPYSKKWKDVLVEESQIFVKFKKIELMPKVFIVPLLDDRSRTIKYFKKGLYKDLLSKNLSFYSQAQSFVSVLLNRYYAADGLRKNFSDFVICVNSLGENLKFKKINHYVFGIYNRLFQGLAGEEGSCNYTLSSASRLRLDDFEALDKFRVEGLVGMENQLGKIIEDYEEKNL